MCPSAGSIPGWAGQIELMVNVSCSVQNGIWLAQATHQSAKEYVSWNLLFPRYFFLFFF